MRIDRMTIEAAHLAPDESERLVRLVLDGLAGAAIPAADAECLCVCVDAEEGEAGESLASRIVEELVRQIERSV